MEAYGYGRRFGWRPCLYLCPSISFLTLFVLDASSSLLLIPRREISGQLDEEIWQGVRDIFSFLIANCSFWSLDLSLLRHSLPLYFSVSLFSRSPFLLSPCSSLLFFFFFFFFFCLKRLVFFFIPRGLQIVFNVVKNYNLSLLNGILALPNNMMYCFFKLYVSEF